MNEGRGQTFAIGASVEEVGGQSRIRQPASNRPKNGAAVEVLERLESCLPESPYQERYRRLAWLPGSVVADDLPEKLAEAGFR
jgi:hypothetical protein